MREFALCYECHPESMRGKSRLSNALPDAATSGKCLPDGQDFRTDRRTANFRTDGKLLEEWKHFGLILSDCQGRRTKKKHGSSSTMTMVRPRQRPWFVIDRDHESFSMTTMVGPRQRRWFVPDNDDWPDHQANICLMVAFFRWAIRQSS